MADRSPSAIRTTSDSSDGSLGLRGPPAPRQAPGSRCTGLTSRGWKNNSPAIERASPYDKVYARARGSDRRLRTDSAARRRISLGPNPVDSGGIGFVRQTAMRLRVRGANRGSTSDSCSRVTDAQKTASRRDPPLVGGHRLGESTIETRFRINVSKERAQSSAMDPSTAAWVQRGPNGSKSGDVRFCAPMHTNSAVVRHAIVRIVDILLSMDSPSASHSVLDVCRAAKYA